MKETAVCIGHNPASNVRGEGDNWLVEEKGNASHIPVNDKSKRDDGTFSRGDFRYDPTDDVYYCPGGKQRTSGTVHKGKTLLYRASKLDCDVCPLKPQCCPKEPLRKTRAISMSMPATSPNRSLAPRTLSSRGASAKRSRSDLHTSSAS